MKHLYTEIFDYAETVNRLLSRTDILKFICAKNGYTYHTKDEELPDGCRISSDRGRYSSMFYRKTLEHPHTNDHRYFIRDPKTKLFTLVK